MEYTYKHHYDIKSLSLIIEDVNNQKHILTQKFHTFNNLAYDYGSQENDYLIREHIKSIQDDLSRYKGTIGFFDYGKLGDLKAYEELLIFFVKNLIDKFDISDKLNTLNDIIANIEAKKEVNVLRFSGRDIIVRRNIYIVDLHEKLRYFQTQFYNNFIPSLRKFLNDVNHILFFEKVLTCVNNLRLGRHFLRNEFNIEYLKNCITGFIWFNHKINARDCSDISLKEFIRDTIYNSEYESTQMSNVKKDKQPLDRIINKIFLEIGDQLQQMEEIRCAEERTDQSKSPKLNNEKTHVSERLRLITRLKAILNELNKMDTCEELSFSAEDPTIQVKEGREGERYLFHVPGSFNLSLKTISNHMTNVLVFMYSWMLRELYHHNLPNDLIDYLNNKLTYSEDFIKFYCTAVTVPLRKSNKKESSLKGEFKYYISMDLAKKIIKTMNEIYDLLYDSLDRTYRKLSLNPLVKGNSVLLKKIDIINTHLSSISKIIQDG
jgi:hypothetical protein